METSHHISLLARLCITILKGYRYCISPLLPPSCRFTPTCSRYALQAVERYGVLRGLWLAGRRILRCHPWGGCGHDPLK